MSLFKVHRRSHQQRADRLEVRFSPTWTGDPAATPSPVPAKGNAAAPPASPPADPHSKPNPPVPPPPPDSPSPPPALSTSPVTPTTTPPVDVPPPTTTSTSVVAPLPVVPTSSSSSVVPPPVVAVPLSSSSSIVQTTPVVVPTLSSKTSSVSTTPTTFRSLPASTVIPTTSSSASPLATSTSSSSSLSTGSIVGIAAASIAGVAIVGVVGIWLLKRYFTSRDEDDSQPSFQRHSWMRNSVALPDDTPSPMVQGPSVNPRPPTMIERKQTLNLSNIGRRGFQDQGAYSQDRTGYATGGNAGMAYTGYQDSPYGVPPMPSYNPGQHVAPSPNATQPFFSPIGTPPLRSPGVASFDETTPPMQHASYDAASGAPVYFSRRDSNMSNAQSHSSAALPAMPNPYDDAGADGYATLSRGSVTPYQAQQYAAISKQLHEPALESIGKGTAPSSVHENSPFEDPASTSAPEQQYQELTPPSLVHARVDSTPPMLPPMRTMSPVGTVGAQPSISQLANAFPPTPKSPTFPAAVANPGSPRAPSFKQAPPLSPAPGAQGQIISVPESVHVGRETPVQFGFTEPATPALAPTPAEAKAVRRVSMTPNAKRMSVASRKSIGNPGRPETMYDEEDAYGGF